MAITMLPVRALVKVDPLDLDMFLLNHCVMSGNFSDSLQRIYETGPHVGVSFLLELAGWLWGPAATSAVDGRG